MSNRDRPDAIETARQQIKNKHNTNHFVPRSNNKMMAETNPSDSRFEHSGFDMPPTQRNSDNMIYMTQQPTGSNPTPIVPQRRLNTNAQVFTISDSNSYGSQPPSPVKKTVFG